MRKQHLLPHAWQWVGLMALVAGIVLSILFFVPFVIQGYTRKVDSIGTIAFGGLLPLSAIILCFTRERIEDERIVELRNKSISITAIIFVVLLFLGPVVNAIIARTAGFEFLVKYNHILGNEWWMLFVYLLIFKISYWVQNKRYSHEE